MNKVKIEVREVRVITEKVEVLKGKGEGE